MPAESIHFVCGGRQELLELLDRLDPKIAELTAAVEQEAHQRPEVLRLMTHLDVGPITGLVYVLVIGTSERFPCGKQRRVSYRHFAGNLQSAPNLPFVALVFSRGTNKQDPLIVPDVFEEGILSRVARFKFLPSENRIVDFASELSLKLSHGFR